MSPAILSPDGKLVGATPFGTDAGTAVLLDISTGEWRAALPNQMGDYYCVAFSPDSAWMAAGRRNGVGGEATLVETTTGKFWSNFGSQAGGVTAVAFSGDSNALAAASGEGPVVLWDVSTKRRIATLANSNNLKWKITSVAVSPNNKWVAAGGYTERWKGWIQVWDVSKVLATKGNADRKSPRDSESRRQQEK